MTTGWRVRRARADDAPALSAMMREPSVVANTYRSPDTTEDDVLRLIEPKDGYLHLVAATPEDEPAAFLALMRHEARPARHVAEFFVITAERSRGRGAARALVEEALRVAFEEWNVARVELGVTADNARAIRIYEALGFRREGIRRAGFARDGVLVDDVLMGLLREEWRARAQYADADA